MVYADLVEDLLKDPGLMTCFSYDVIIDTMTAYQPYIHGKGSQGRVDTWQQWGFLLYFYFSANS